jgi:hypothetical protein
MKKTTLAIFAALLVITTSVTTLAFEASLGDSFEDVTSDQYYYEPVNNMALMGVISGYGNNQFGPNDYVTRAQLATVLDRFDDKVIGGHFGEDLEDETRIVDLMILLCQALDEMEFSDKDDEDGRYQAICINRENMQF